MDRRAGEPICRLPEFAHAFRNTAFPAVVLLVSLHFLDRHFQPPDSCECLPQVI